MWKIQFMLLAPASTSTNENGIIVNLVVMIIMLHWNFLFFFPRDNNGFGQIKETKEWKRKERERHTHRIFDSVQCTIVEKNMVHFLREQQQHNRRRKKSHFIYVVTLILYFHLQVSIWLPLSPSHSRSLPLGCLPCAYTTFTNGFRQSVIFRKH